MDRTKITEFKYKTVYKFIYRYSGFIATLLLIAYLIPVLQNIPNDNTNIFWAIVLGLLIFGINKYFFNLFKVTPYKIVKDDKGITGTDFFLYDKTVRLDYAEIDKLSGGIFDGKLSGLMKLCNTKDDKCIGFFHKINNAKILETEVLAKVKKDIYDDVLDKLGMRREKFKKKADKRKK